MPRYYSSPKGALPPQGVYEVEVSDKKRILTKHRAKVKAAVCPLCGEVSLYLESKELDKIIKDVVGK